MHQRMHVSRGGLTGRLTRSVSTAERASSERASSALSNRKARLRGHRRHALERQGSQRDDQARERDI